MGLRFGISFLLLLLFLGVPAHADVSVKGYFRSDGTYVKPHWRSSPNNTVLDNWSYCGNRNPHTGEIGSTGCGGFSDEGFDSQNGNESSLEEQTSDEVLERCILGYGGWFEARRRIDDARDVLSSADLHIVENRVMEFERSLQKNCSKDIVRTSEFLSGIENLGVSHLRSMADSILLGNQ